MTVALKRSKTLDHPIITAMQKRHFILMDVLPAIGTVASIAILAYTGVSGLDIALCAAMWALTVVGIEIGYHRYFSHDAFRAHPVVRHALVILACMGGQGTVISWAANHRLHHEFSDAPEDTHTPHHSGTGFVGALKGFVHAQLTWKWTYPYANPSVYTAALVKDKSVAALSKLYYVWVILGIALPGAIGGLVGGSLTAALTATLLAGVIRLFVSQQGTFLINSVCHMWGTRPYRSKDRSRNNFWFVPVSLGGAWHNNHHAFPYTANNQLRWWQVDPGYWVIWSLERVGLVWDVKRVTPRAERKKRLSAPTPPQQGESDVVSCADSRTAL